MSSYKLVFCLVCPIFSFWATYLYYSLYPIPPPDVTRGHQPISTYTTTSHPPASGLATQPDRQLVSRAVWTSLGVAGCWFGLLFVGHEGNKVGELT